MQLDFDSLPRYIFYSEAAREWVPFTVRLKNTGTRPIRFWNLSARDVVRLSAETPDEALIEGEPGIISDPIPYELALDELRPGMSHAYRWPIGRSDFWHLGLHLSKPGTYAVAARLSLPKPLREAVARGTVEVVPYEEKNVLWKKQERISVVPGLDGKQFKPFLRRMTLMKYEMPDGPWLFYTAPRDDQAINVFMRLEPIRRDSPVSVMLDPLDRPHGVHGDDGREHLVLTSPLNYPTAHILFRGPGEAGYETGIYLVVALWTNCTVLERRWVGAFARAKLVKEADGRVVLVEEK
ncbi:MAG: hypothetical protein AB1696_28985 [Planctomycetota bacterium]